MRISLRLMDGVEERWDGEEREEEQMVSGEGHHYGVLGGTTFLISFVALFMEQRLHNPTIPYILHVSIVILSIRFSILPRTFFSSLTSSEET